MEAELSDFDLQVKNKFNQQEKQEDYQLDIEKRIKKIPGAADLIPARKYGQVIDANSFGITLKSLIDREDPQLAAFLGFATDRHRKEAEQAESRKEVITRMNELTEELRAKNQQSKKIIEQEIATGINSLTGRRFGQ